jgi:hypothetical protein
VPHVPAERRRDEDDAGDEEDDELDSRDGRRDDRARPPGVGKVERLRDRVLHGDRQIRGPWLRSF